MAIDWKNVPYQEGRRIVVAFTFYSRIPLPSAWFSAETSHASRYFPLVGWVVGGLCVTVWGAAQTIMSEPAALLLGMIVAVLITGALHEDGWADTCDGLGGGRTPEECLQIMKDSRIGTYGATGLILILLLKFTALLQIESATLAYVWIAGHSFSRFAAIAQLRFLPYVQAQAKSKSGAMTEFSGSDLLISAIFGLFPLLFIGSHVWTGLLAVALVWCALSVYFVIRLSGVTGDCLGATQQMSEVIFYLILGANI